MLFRTRLPVKAYLLVIVMAGAAGLSACGGGGEFVDGDGDGDGDNNSTIRNPEIIRAPDILITPPENRVPEAVGSIPRQSMTVGPTARTLSVAPYFRDPDDDQLTYTAVSDHPEIVAASMSGDTLTLDPRSAGRTEVTVTASDGNSEASQAIATTVRRRQSVTTTVNTAPTPPSLEPEPEPEPSEPEPEIKLTGIRVEARSGFVSLYAVPRDAVLKGVGFSWNPFAAGRFSLINTYDYDHEMHMRFWCSYNPRYIGSVDISVQVDNPDGGQFRKTMTLTCS